MLECENITTKQILEEIVKNRSEIKSYIDALQLKQQSEVDELRNRVKTLELQNQDLKNELEESKKAEKRNNIIVFGITRREKLACKDLCEELNSLLNINLGEEDINDFYFLGKNPDSPLKIEFSRYLKKKLVIENKKLLKGQNVNIVDDLTQQQRNQYQLLRKHQILARNDGKSNCYIRKNTLHVDGQSYSYKDLLKLQDTGNDLGADSTPSTSISSLEKSALDISEISKPQGSPKKAGNVKVGTNTRLQQKQKQSAMTRK